MMKIIFFILFFISYVIAENTFWQGKIGDQQVYMELTCDPFTEKNKDEEYCHDTYYFTSDTLVNILMKEGDPVGKNQIRFSGTWNKVSELFDLVLQDGELSGTLLRGDEIFPVSLNPYKVKDLDTLKADLLKFKEEVFAPKIRDLVFEMKGWKIGGKEDKECYYSDVQYWKDATWFLTDKGVQIKPHYPYNIVGCRDAYAFILTPEWMEKYKNRNYPDILKELFKIEKDLLY